MELHLPHRLSLPGTSRAREGVQRSYIKRLIAKPLPTLVAAAWRKICARLPRIGSKGPAPSWLPRQSLQLSPLGELQGTCKRPSPCRDPPKKAPPKQPGLQIYKYLLRTCALEFTSGPGRNACPLRLRRPTLRGTGPESGVPWSRKEGKRMGQQWPHGPCFSLLTS